MLACIACSAKEGGEDGSRAAATPAVRSLTSQLKDMVLKFSGSGKQYRAPTAAGSPSFRGRGFGRHYPGFIDDTSFTPTHRTGAGDVGAGVYASRTGAEGTNGSARAASSATWDITGHGWPGIDEEDGGVRVDVDAAVPREWMAQVEPGVQITFVTLPGGGNDLKRIRFSREMFNKWEAQRWWGENYDRIVELYNVQTFSGRQQAGGSTPNSSVDDSILRDSSYSRAGSTRPESPVAMMPSSSKDPMSRSVSWKAMMPPPPPPSYAAGPSSSNRAAPCYPYAAAVPDPSDHVWAHHFNMLNTAASGGGGGGPSSYDPSRATTSSRDEASVSISNASDMEAAEWIEQDEPGVCLTIRELGDGTRELRRVRFSRERFGEDRAKVWWEQNRDRIQAQYL